ncbi:MAG: hypothetical protein RMJ28_04800 [Nitrososphaerota archaeon]|nr:hypothetical protein [Candidatus Calditenuaceae archaeon]MDW8073538.1 hypothetical protein [Nitrososphaerota archaeon]
MELSLRERIELMRQGIIQRAIIPLLEERGFFPSPWKRPVSLEDMELREDGWIPFYTRYTTWETYVRGEPLHLYFNTFYGDVHEKAYRYCFVEYMLPWPNFDLNRRLIGLFTRLNLRGGGYVWKCKRMVDITVPASALMDIEKNYDELLLALMEAGVVDAKANPAQGEGRARSGRS